MSAPKTKPDFYIGISTQDPPTIVSIGRTIDGMEEIEVRLDQPDEDKLNIFKGKIEDIQTGEDYFKLADQDQIELDNDPTIQTINYPMIDNNTNLQVEEQSQEADITEPSIINPGTLAKANSELQNLQANNASEYEINESLSKSVLPLTSQEADIEDLVKTMNDHELAANKAREERVAITETSLFNPGTLAKAKSELQNLQANNASEYEINVVTNKIEDLENKAKEYGKTETDERNKWKSTNAELKKVRGFGKKTKRRRNKRRKTKRRKTKRSKSKK